MKKGLFQGMGQLLLMVVFVSVAYAEFGLLLGSFRNRDNAERYAAEIVTSLTHDPCNAFVEGTQVPETGFWYRVCLGPFVSKKEALAKKEVLGSKKPGLDMIVVKTRADAKAFEEAMPTHDRASPPGSSPEPAKTLPISDADEAPASATRTRDMTLTWDAQKDPAPAGYKIYYDTKSGPPYTPDPSDYVAEGPPPIMVDGDITETTLHGLTKNKTYYFVITAFNSREGPESPFSEEVSIFPEAPPPVVPPVVPPVASKPKIAETDQLPAESKEATAAEPSASRTDLEVADISVQDTPGSLVLDDFSVDSQDSGLLTAGDTLEIEIPGQPEMSMAYDVAPDGNIYMMSIGRVSVQGLSLANLERGLTQHLKRFIDKGEMISIKLVKRERYVQITGGVRYPGWYRVPATTTLKKLFQTAGGLLEGVTYSGTKLRRETRGGYRDIRIGDGKVVLQPNDMVIVPSPEVYQKKVDSGDLLFINVPGRGEGKDQYLQEKMYKLNQFEVDNNGYVYISDVGHIYVNNLTTAQIKEAIAKKLPKYLARDTKMEVSIIEKRQFVQVLGHVANPGVYIVSEGANVQAALNLAGGAVDGAVMSDARILRKRGEETERIPINLYQFTITGDPRLLTPLHENDILFVPISPNFGNIKRTLMAWTPPLKNWRRMSNLRCGSLARSEIPGLMSPRKT